MRARRTLLLLALAGIVASPVLEAAPVDPEGAAAEVRDLLEKDDWRRALALARSYGPGDREHPELRCVLGEALYRAGEIEQAEEELAAVVEAEDPLPRALLTLGLIRTAQAKYAEASTLVGRAMEAAPDDPYVLFRAAGYQPTRAETIRVLEKYLELGEEEDPDRLEGARGTIRLYRALGEREVWVPTERPNALEMPLRMLPDGRGSVLGYLVRVQLGGKGKPVKVLLDTGSPGFFLSGRIARKRGFVPLSEETTFGGGGSGRHRSGRGLFDSLVLGGLAYRDALVSTSPRAIDPAHRYHGLIGLTPFEGYRITLDLSEHRLVLEPSEGEGGGSPYWVIAGQLVIRAGSDGGSSGLFLLDTGATRSLLDVAFAGSIEGVSLGEPSRVRGYGGSRQGARTVEGAVLRFQGFATDGRPMNAADLSMRSRLSGVEISGFLGLDLLEGAVITIDTVARTVRIRKRS